MFQLSSDTVTQEWLYAPCTGCVYVTKELLECFVHRGALQTQTICIFSAQVGSH